MKIGTRVFHKVHGYGKVLEVSTFTPTAPRYGVKYNYHTCWANPHFSRREDLVDLSYLGETVGGGHEMNYGISSIGGPMKTKTDALNEAVRMYGALPVIQLMEYHGLEDYRDLTEKPFKRPDNMKIITFRLERTQTGMKYIEQ